MLRELIRRLTERLGDNDNFLKNYLKSKTPRVYFSLLLRQKTRSNHAIHYHRVRSEAAAQAKLFWRRNMGLRIDYAWHQAYAAINGVDDIRYIPEDIYYRFIEPRLNRYDLASSYEDKNAYNRIFSGSKMPKTIVRNMNGSFFDGAYTLISPDQAIAAIASMKGKRLVIKPSLDTGGGKGVAVIDMIPNAAEHDNISMLLASYQRDFIVQEYLEQHASLKQLHPSSLNTLRIMTLHLNGQIHVLSRVLRMGVGGSKIDNCRAGGITCGVDCAGKLNAFATDLAFERSMMHPTTHAVFDGMLLPYTNEVERFAEELHRRLHYFSLASWDIALDEMGSPVLIEVNLRDQDINLHQRNNGPLFGDLTSQILAMCRKK